MPNYLVKSYKINRTGALDDACERARRVGEQEDGVRYVRTTFIPADETMLYLFAASSAKALERALSLASLQHERIVEAMEAVASTTVAKSTS